MIEVPGQCPNLSIDDKVFMHGDVVVLSESSPEQAYLIIGVDPAPAHPGSVKKIPPGNPIGHWSARPPPFEAGPYLFSKFLCHSFVRIEDQNPVGRRLCHPEILL
jgi:hypothetical protein